MNLAQYFEWNIDFEGQRMTDLCLNVILPISAIIAFVYGYIQQSLVATLAIFGGGILLSLLVVLPPWPMYNSHPVKWLPVEKPIDSPYKGEQTKAE
ncbi:unnamed protein product [Umbelopsis sp. WA50703]